jgi:hypothetical protein
MKLETWHSAKDKRRWKIVRADDYTDVAGEIVTADEATGECYVKVGGEFKTLRFKPYEIMLVLIGEHIWKPYPGGGSICPCGAMQSTNGTVWVNSVIYDGPCSSSAPSAPKPDSREIEIDGAIVTVTGPPS